MRLSGNSHISRSAQDDTHDLKVYRSCQIVVKEVVLGLLVVFLDQVAKLMFSNQVINTGVAFGIGKNIAWEVFSLIVLIVVGWMLNSSEKKWERLGLVMVFSAGISNLTDRLFLGGVRDFIFWPILNVYGNVADVFLVVGVGVILIDYLRTRNFQ